MQFYIGLVIVFIVILINIARRQESILLSGFWMGSAEFCERSNLDLLAIYFDDPGVFSSSRTGYILMKNADGFILNNPFNIHLRCWSFTPSVQRRITYRATITWIEDQEVDFFPAEQLLTYYPYDGKLVLHADDVVYALCYRDNQVSDTKDAPDCVADGTDDTSDSVE